MAIVEGLSAGLVVGGNTGRKTVKIHLRLLQHLSAMRGGDGCYSEFSDQGRAGQKRRVVGSTTGDVRGKSTLHRNCRVKIALTAPYM